VSLEAPTGLEPVMEVLQTSALPLGYGARTDSEGSAVGAAGGRVERETGFEPATSTLARSHSTTELFPLSQRVKVTQPPGPIKAKGGAMEGADACSATLDALTG
jgi:hypothetical protein